MADIEHSALPDELLHEPKGASTAAAGTVYVANGAGSGTFSKIPLESLDIAFAQYSTVTPKNLDDVKGLTTKAPDVSDGTLEVITSDVLKADTLNQLNKNISELAKYTERQDFFNTATNSVVKELYNTLNGLITVLKNEGLIA